MDERHDPCRDCLWSDQCRTNEETCEHHSPIDMESFIEEEYHKDLDDRHAEYMDGVYFKGC